MRINELQIERFGVWRDLTLPLSANGVTVFYGPNEAGKSTLMRFMRSILYGYHAREERDSGREGKRVTCAGRLQLEHSGNKYEIRRESQAGTRGQLWINGHDEQPQTDTLLKKLTGGASETLFEHVFAIGLQELQELSTLDGEEVARHIYGISLGLDGERIVRAQSALDREQRSLLDHDRNAGEILDLARRLEAIDQDVARIGDRSGRHDELHSDREQTSTQIERLKKRQADLLHEIRGRQFLHRVHGPWQKERQLRLELDRRPAEGLSHDLLDQHDTIDLELQDLDERRRQALLEAPRLHQQAEDLGGESHWEEHAGSIRSLAEQRDTMRALELRVEDDRRRLESLQGSLGRDAVGENSPALMQQLSAAAAKYRRAVSRRRRHVRRYKLMNEAVRRRSNWLATQMQSLGGLTIPQARSNAERRVEDLEELSRLRLEEKRLSLRVDYLRLQMQLETTPRQLPAYFYGCLWFFGIAGLTLMICGLWGVANNWVWGGDTAWVVGMIYALLGLCCGGVTWTMKEHFDPKLTRDPALSRRLREAETALAEVRRACDRLIQADAKTVRGNERFAEPSHMYEKLSQGRRPTLPVGVPRTTPAARELAYVPLPPQFQPTSADYHAGQTRIPALAESLAARVADREVDYGNPVETALGEPQIHEVDVQVLLRRRLVDLDEWERWEQRLERRRQQLLRHRERLADRKRDQQATKQHWLATLRQLGLPESLRTRDAHSVWDRVSSAREVHHEHRSAREAYDRDLRQLQEYRSRVESLAGKIHGPGRHDQLVTDYHRTLSDWEQRLHSHTGSRQERARLGQLAEQKRREAESLDSDIERLRGKRQSLLSRAGVASRSELEQRLHDQRRVTDQQAHWESARDELHHIASTEPELAIVEEDLQAFHPERNRQSIESLRRELAEIEEQLPGHHEQLGRFKQELTELEQDRRPSGLRYDRTQLANELQQAVERWAAVQLAGQAIERVRGKVEKTSQPQLLKHASKYLTDLTSGKYHNVWTPLGERHLMIDDDSGQSQRVEHLSSGTREQVFLAVRLAMVKDFADRGADLPMVLDDVFVNFDQVRTESAVRTLLEFADQGQQVLFFTCHLHLAHLFENQGVEPVWLPGHAATVDERRAS